MKVTKLKLLAGAAAVSMVFGAAPAQAGSLAQGLLDISNFLITDTSGVALDASAFSLLIAKDTTDGSVKFNATSASDAQSLVPPGVLDMNQVCVANCAGFGQNNYTTRAAFGETQNVARADTYLAGNPITGFGGGPLGASARSVSEVQSLGGDGTSQANLGLQTTYQFAVGQTQAVGFSFDAIAYLVASITANGIPGYSAAQGSISWVIDIKDAAGNNVFHWEPDGVVNDVGETADGCDLNAGLGTLLPGTGYTSSCSGKFFRTTAVLTAGTIYQLNIRHGTDADASFIPEPGVLGLLGAGLLGMGAIARRRKAS